MKNKYNATKIYWHSKCGYFTAEGLDRYFELSKAKASGITKSDFQIFDSKFESEVHKKLFQFVEDYNHKQSDQVLAIHCQVPIDIGEGAFCEKSYKLDFLIAASSFKIPEDLNAFIRLTRSRYERPRLFPRMSIRKGHPFLFVEAKGYFPPEAHYKHLLLEKVGLQHGSTIEIVQYSPNPVSRGKGSYKTLKLADLETRLVRQFIRKKDD